MDLINREDLRNDLTESVVFTARCNDSAEMRGARKIIERIESAPTVDAVPVKDLEALVDFFYIDGCISKRYLTMLHGLIDMHKRKDGDE